MDIDIYKMKYKFEKSINYLILGEEFVKNNKNKGKLIINNKKYSLNQLFIIIIKFLLKFF